MQSYQGETTWFLAQIKPNCYKIAERNLRRQRFKTFLPLHEEVKRNSGKFITRLRPLFTGYIFVAFDPSKDGWRAINSTYGIVRLVSFGDDPKPVPLELVSRLMARCDNNGKFLPLHSHKNGDNVKISSGPFAEFVATVETINSSQRVWVLLDLMGRTIRVAVQLDDLREVKQGKQNL